MIRSVGLDVLRGNLGALAMGLMLAVVVVACSSDPVRVQEAPGALSGRVYPEGSFARVEAQGANGRVWQSRADDLGFFALSDLPEGLYRLSFDAEGFLPLRFPGHVRVRGAEVSTVPDVLLLTGIDIEGGVDVVGRVMDAETGEPVEGALLGALCAGVICNARYGASEGDGRYTLRSVPPNYRFRLNVEHPGYRAGSVFIEPQPGGTVVTQDVLLTRDPGAK